MPTMAPTLERLSLLALGATVGAGVVALGVLALPPTAHARTSGSVRVF